MPENVGFLRELGYSKLLRNLGTGKLQLRAPSHLLATTSNILSVSLPHQLRYLNIKFRIG
jgi:hypothetical protein